MDRKALVEKLFDKKLIKILRLFVNNPDKEYYLREISRITKVSLASTHRILNQLKELELIKENKEKYLKTYISRPENIEVLSGLLEDKKTAIKEFSDFISGTRGVDIVIQHGEEEKEKASVLIVGEDMDQNSVREKTNEIKEKYKFNIIYLFLSRAQYEQMSSMGLYKGKKVILYKS